MSRWDDLTMAQKAELIGIYVRGGKMNLNDIKKYYNTSPQYPGIGEEFHINSVKYDAVTTPNEDKNERLEEIGIIPVTIFPNTIPLRDVDVSEQANYLERWYNDPETIRRIRKNVGDNNRFQEALRNKRKGEFKSRNIPHKISASPYRSSNDINTSIVDPSTRAHHDKATNLTVFSQESLDSPDKDFVIMHEVNHEYDDLHKNLFRAIDTHEAINPNLDAVEMEYLSKPSEIHSRMMEIRKFLNKKPGEPISKEELQKATKGLKREDLKNYNEDILLDWLNTIASVDSLGPNLSV